MKYIPPIHGDSFCSIDSFISEAKILDNRTSIQCISPIFKKLGITKVGISVSGLRYVNIAQIIIYGNSFFNILLK